MDPFVTPLQKLAARENISVMEANDRFIAMPEEERERFQESEAEAFSFALRKLASEKECPNEKKFLEQCAERILMDWVYAWAHVKECLKLRKEISSLKDK